MVGVIEIESKSATKIAKIAIIDEIIAPILII